MMMLDAVMLCHDAMMRALLGIVALLLPCIDAIGDAVTCLPFIG